MSTRTAVTTTTPADVVSAGRARRALEADLALSRHTAGRDYIDRGDVAYQERSALRTQLCHLIALGNQAQVPVALTLAETRWLVAAGCLTDDHHLTPFGAEQAAVAIVLADDDHAVREARSEELNAGSRGLGL